MSEITYVNPDDELLLVKHDDTHWTPAGLSWTGWVGPWWHRHSLRHGVASTPVNLNPST